MANTKISELGAAATLTGAEQVPVVQSGVTVRTTITDLLARVLDGAPGALDTLNELAAALGDDANFAATVTTALAGKQDTLEDGTYALTSPIPPSHWIAQAAASVASTSFANALANIDYIDLPPHAIDKLGCEVVIAGSGGSTVRLIAWHDNDGVPGMIAAQGTVSSETTGARTIDVSFTHNGGRLWLAAVNQGGTAAQLRYVAANLRAVFHPTTQPLTNLVSSYQATIAGVAPDNPTGAWATAAPPRVSVHAGPLV